MDGIFNIYKPSGMTSHDIVFKVRKIVGTKRVGHAGTLDPMATGVLPVLVGNACSAQEIIMEHDKTYIAGIRFGTVTDTGDVTGNLISTSDILPSEDEVIRVGESFIGKQMQVPPMYSAIKVDGKKLYELAREGKTIERQSREIIVYSSKMLYKLSDTDYYFEFSVSKGTYIRTLAEDIGKALGCGAALFSLERIVCGEFNKENSVTLETLMSLSEKSDADGVMQYLIPTEASFYHLPIVKLSEFYSRLCKNGLEIYLKKANISKEIFGDENRCRLYDSDNNFFAIGVLSEYKDGPAVKAKIRFDTGRRK